MFVCAGRVVLIICDDKPITDVTVSGKYVYLSGGMLM